jgi:hypothetical protein
MQNTMHTCWNGGSEWYRRAWIFCLPSASHTIGPRKQSARRIFGGVQLKWSLPIRMFAEDDDSYHYIPRMN